MGDMGDSKKPCDHPACWPIDDLAQQCEFTRTRRGGPGGQHRNKVDSAVVVKHLPSGISGQAAERRSQHENRAVAIDRLRINLALEFRNTGVPTEPSPLWLSRCKHGKITISPNHVDFACVLAEALDWVVFLEFQISLAADGLGCSTSQLIKLLKSNDSVLEWVNRQRKQRKMGPLR